MVIVDEPPGALGAAYPEPLWLQAVATIAGEIDAGHLKPGVRLPPERELCAQLGISRVTLRKALIHLVDDGVLDSAPGRGWHVALTRRAPRKDWPNSLEAFTETATRMGLVASSMVLRAEILPATFDEAEQLLVAPGTPLFHLERVRLLDTLPIALDHARVPADFAPQLMQVDFTRASLYEELAAAGLDVARADSTIEAREADAALAAHLGIQLGKPVLVMQQVAVDAAERPLLASDIRYSGDRYRLRTFFSRASG